MKYFLPILLLFIGYLANGQIINHVPNPSFEQYTNCPTGYSQIANCVSWRMYTTSGTSDYFNTCTNGTAGIPANAVGYQFALGNAYAGLFTRGNNFDYKEYLAAEITPMIPGAYYEVSMSVSLADFMGKATNDLGIYFYDSGPYTVSGFAVLPVTPQVSYSGYGIITDKSNWTRLTGTFMADSAYDNIVIGGFTHFTSLPYIQVTGTPTNIDYSYFYIDSVVVRRRDTLEIGFTDNTICGIDSFMVSYYAQNNVYGLGNTFTIQLSNSIGSFANPINIGSKQSTASGSVKVGIPSTVTQGTGYRMRVISNNGPDTSADNGKNIALGMSIPAKPIATSNTPACANGSLNLSAATSGPITNLLWIGPNGFTSTLSNLTVINPDSSAAGNFIIQAYNYGCMAADTETVTVVKAPTPVFAGSNTPVCAGDTLKLIAATVNPTGTTYSWSGPNGFNATSKDVNITPAAINQSGDYIVTGVRNGCQVKDTISVGVLALPVNVVATGPTSVCEADTIKLTATSTTTGVTYSWTGPSAFNSMAQNPQRFNAQALHAGNYIVTCTNGICKAKDTVVVQVNPLPNPVVASSNGPLCDGSAGSLSVTTGLPGTTFSWNGPSGFSSTSQNPSFTATSALAGDYVVAASYNGCTKKDTTTMVVKPVPVATASYPGAVCEGQQIAFSATSSPVGSSFTWNGPGSYTSALQNPIISPAALIHNGIYSVTAVLNGCTSSAATINVIVYSIPATPTITSNSPVCPNTPINLTTSNSAGSTYSWIGPASFASIQQNPVIGTATVANAGIYSVTATANGCTSAAATTTVVVATPAATYTAGANSPVCAGGKLNLSVSNMPGATFNWSGPNGFAAITQNPSIAPVPLNAGGTYSVYATLNGCQYPAVTTNVAVNSVSSLGVYPSPNDTLCINNANASFVAVPFNAGTAPQYQWYKNNNLIGGATNISYPASGIADGDSFYCRMTVTGICADPLVLYSNKVGMTVLPLTAGPSVTITADPGTLLSPWQLVKFTAVATNAGALPKYQWKRNSQDVIGATSDVWSANNLSNLDTISCVVTSGVWCASPADAVSNRMVVNIKTGITDISADKQLMLYPNPNNGLFVVYLPPAPSRGEYASVDVVDALGRIVYSSQQLQSTAQKLEIALPASVANGVYMLKLMVDERVYHARFTVGR